MNHIRNNNIRNKHHIIRGTGKQVDNESLAVLIKANNTDYKVKKDALDVLTDQSVIDNIAKTAKDDWIRLEAAIKCKNNKILNEFAKYHHDQRIRLEAAIELKTEFLLCEIAKSAQDDYVQEVALNHIADKELLENIVINGNNEKIRVEVPGSKLETGSSPRNTFGSCSNARAIPTLCFWPPLNCSILRFI